MKARLLLCFWVWLCSLSSQAQNNQIKWSRNQALHDGSATNGVKLSGAGLYFNLIELPPMVTDHQEFKGRASNVGSFSISAQNPLNGHATQVASVGAAMGVNPLAKGIAFGATIQNYSDRNFLQTLRSIASPLSGAPLRQRLVVNYSSAINIMDGDPHASLYFGTYDDVSNEIDDIVYQNPFCLPVAASGNDGKKTNPGPNSAPLSWQYDKLPGGAQTAKNTLVVGNVFDMLLDTKRQLSLAYIDATSGSGPTDDLRIKPELVAPGHQFTTATRINEFSDQYYTSYTNSERGTSLSAPTVSGTALLLQELYYTHYRQYMRSATVKGLLIHTADKIYPASGGSSETINWGISSAPGPDPFCGYGVINGTAAAQAILTRGSTSIIDEKQLLNGERHSVDIPTKAGQAVTVSLSWTDPPRYPLNQFPPLIENDTTRQLVNDLGIVVLERPMNSPAVVRRFHPFSLIHASGRPIAVNDRANRADPYEKIKFTPLPDHVYSIVIFCENAQLATTLQKYTLIVTGLGQDDQQQNQTCLATNVIEEPIRIGIQEEATNQVTLAAEIMPTAGLAGFNAPTIVLGQGALIRNDDAILFTATCSRSGLRQAAEELQTTPTDSTSGSLLSQWWGQAEAADMQLFPNPVEDRCLIVSKSVIKEIWVYNLVGKLVSRSQPHTEHTAGFDTADFPPGLYILVVEDDQGVKKTIKMTRK